MARATVWALILLAMLAAPVQAQVINGETPYDSSMLASSSEQRAARDAEARAEADQQAARQLEDMLEKSGSRPSALR